MALIVSATDTATARGAIWSQERRAKDADSPAAPSALADLEALCLAATASPDPDPDMIPQRLLPPGARL